MKIDTAMDIALIKFIDRDRRSSSVASCCLASTIDASYASLRFILVRVPAHPGHGPAGRESRRMQIARLMDFQDISPHSHCRQPATFYAQTYSRLRGDEAPIRHGSVGTILILSLGKSVFS